MIRIPKEELLERYYERVFDSGVDLEDAELEEEWLKTQGYTPVEFAEIVKEESFTMLGNF